jgi:hypothetical protein
MTAQTVRHATAWAALAAFLSVGALDAHAQQCTTLATDLRFPVGVAQSNLGNLLVSENGIRNVLHQGRISIIGRDGARRTLVDGLPSANSDVGDPAGPAGLLMRGRTLYVAIGIGDTILVKAGDPTARVGNPSPASRLFSSVLAMHFSANAERTTLGFSLTAADHDALANGDKVTLSNGGGDKLTLELIANFPDYIPAPLPTAADNVRGSNPFDLALIGNRLYVTDGGRNLVWEADIHSGEFAPLATFGQIPNPMFPALGPPMTDAVPTGIREFDGQLFVTLFRGVPFAAGTSVVEQIDPETGAHAAVATGLKTAIDVWPTKEDGENTSLFVLQHSSGPAPFFAGPGTLSHIQASGSTTLASCLARPSSMVRDEQSGAFYVTEVVTGRLVVVR